MERVTYTINQFVDNFGISRALLYRLWADSEGPEFYYVGRKRFISHDSATTWMKCLEGKSRRPNPSHSH